MRRAIEAEVAAEAAMRRTDADMVAIDAALRKIDEAVAEPKTAPGFRRLHTLNLGTVD